ncbi:hypothetical protein GJW-30_1_04203 [Variibacter gotjawalensis]|uniref:Mucoidy inhibitor MuiA family protein n=1 Tax=Variibacter gotjawalensis TaxID=1333996 RepID=A0A0S3Q0D5_9BRAD|nr:mucoidy inhibitor MuiA family protein [Variibacter gotjawalensis]NIK47484.1 uncharacterized protein (TIGR02231 family) [Variibacter gotjawalensis]RZS49379.1 uncharacterized protein (TIGR02231 family) [Variibacter gotjawalensis]BAT61643.1 hypothetical protein GJW-30_1_04203 [Variibacter gotjawalensis]
MRKIAIATALVCAAPITAAVAAEQQATSNVDAVTVYPDGASVTRVVRTTVPSGDTTLVLGDFPPGLDPASLRIEGTGPVTVGSIDARPPRPERPANNPALERRLEALRDERATLDDAIAAATARRKFVERYAAEVPFGPGEKAEGARPIGDWRQAFSAVADELAAVDVKIREAKLKQRELDREIQKVEAEARGNPPRKMEVRVDLAAAQAGEATFRITYTMRSARWMPLYDARLDSGNKDRKPAIEIVRRAEIVQQTGEDWQDVALSVSTVRTAAGGNAPELGTLIVRYPQENARPKAYYGGARAPASVAQPAPITQADEQRERRAAEQEAVVDASGFQVVFRVPGRVSVAANEGAKSLRIATGSVEPELMVRAVPAVNPTAFLEAEFKHNDEAPLLPGRVSIYRDGVFVGRSVMPATPKEENVRLGFGADEKIKVTRAVSRKNEGTSGVITTVKTDEREFKIAVRNGHARPMKIQVEDQLPVSEHQDVQVEMLPSTTAPTFKDLRDKRGVLGWVVDAKPGEQKEIKFAWRVKWPNDKAVVYQPGS